MEILRFLGPGNNLITKVNEKVNDTPIMTKEDGCFSEMLDSEKLEKLLKLLNKKVLKYKEACVVNSNVMAISLDEDFLYKLLCDLSHVENGDSYKEKILEIFENTDLSESEIGESKILDIKKHILNHDEKTAIQYFIYLNKIFTDNQIENVHNMIRISFEQYIYSLVMILKRVKIKEDLESILFYIGDNSDNLDRVKNLMRFYKYNGDLALSVMCKEIINSYVKAEVNSFKRIRKVEREIVNRNNYKRISYELDSDGVKDSEVVSLILKSYISELYQKISNNNSTLCWDCANGYVSKCEKIRDRKKENIEDYPFVVSGYQTILNGELDRFIVTECKNFRSSRVLLKK